MFPELLDWSLPYSHEAIEWAIQRLDLSDVISVCGEETPPAYVKKKCAICLESDGKWVVWYRNIKVPTTDSTRSFPIPEKVNSGPAAIVNATLLLKTKRSAHPGALIYLQQRENDYKAACLSQLSGLVLKVN